MATPEARLYRANYGDSSVEEIYPKKGEKIGEPEASRIMREVDFRCHVLPIGDIDHGNVCVVVDKTTYKELPGIDIGNFPPEERLKRIAEDLRKKYQGPKPLITGVIF